MPDIIVQDAGEETILYSAEIGAVHILNPTAKYIWDLCDGQHTIADMEQSLRATFDIPADYSVRNDVQKALAALAAKGLIQNYAT